ncbi:MAG: DNA polymerase III subunit delta [Thermoleophilaceae bacterium]|nr:DNA polymerase III subunit delta [Thermoleophilaceae bacterium]
MAGAGAPVAAWYVKGDDPALVGEEVRRLTRELSGGDATAVEDLSGEDVDVAAIVDACRTPPFLAERRVVVAREIGRFRTEPLEPLIEWLADPLPSTALVLTSGGGQVSQRLLAALRKVGQVVDTAVGTGKARGQWLASQLQQAPVRLDPPAARLVGEHLGEDVGRLTNLLESLAAAYGEGARVGTEELGPFLGQAGGVAPWELTDAIDRGDTALALDRLHRTLRGGGRHPLEVIASLRRHYTRMLRLDGAGARGEKEAAAVLGIRGSTFPAGKALTQVQRLGHRGVRRAVILLATADLDLHGAQAWPDELVMEVLVARLSKLAAARPS